MKTSHQIEQRRHALIAARQTAYAAQEWTQVNEITKRLAKLPVKGEADYPKDAKEAK